MLHLWMAQSVYAQSYQVQLGDKIVIIQQESKNKPGPTYVHLHQNEATALKAARAVIQTTGGQILTLKHGGGRNIIFHLQGKRYEFDPNRIFTDVGIKKTLQNHGRYSRPAHSVVNHLAMKIKSLLPQRGKVIGVHNNQSYSLKNYYPGKSLASEAHAIYHNPHHFFRNFYVVTQKNDYLRFKQLKYNSILQTPKPKNDGSLSVYLVNRSYINVEAGLHQLTQQMNMLKIV